MVILAFYSFSDHLTKDLFLLISFVMVIYVGYLCLLAISVLFFKFYTSYKNHMFVRDL